MLPACHQLQQAVLLPTNRSTTMWHCLPRCHPPNGLQLARKGAPHVAQRGPLRLRWIQAAGDALPVARRRVGTRGKQCLRGRARERVEMSGTRSAWQLF